MTELHDLTAIEQRAALRAREISPVELTRHYLDRIRRLDGSLGAFVEVTSEAALARAAALGEPDGALWGLSFADKDLVPRAGVPTRFGSRLHSAGPGREDFIPDATADQAAVLDEAGGISVGKTNTPEFGLTGYTETQIAPPARDPWNPGNGSGGSSGGAATAVAAGLLPLAPASDGGGSIRIPAATVGVVGIKPSRGRVPFASGFDSPGGLPVAGPIARNIADAALLLDVQVAGRPHPYATAAPGSGPFLDAASTAPRAAMRVGVTTVSPWDDDEDIRLDPDAARAVDVAMRLLSDAGHGVDPFDWRPRGYAEMFTTIWRTSAARMTLTDAELELVEPITAWLVREGRALTGSQVLDALAAATAFERETITAFSPFDAVLTPALGLSARPIGWFDAVDAAKNFAQQVQYAPYSSFVNVAGLPAMVVPVTQDASGHPVCVQLIGRPGGEAAIIALGAHIERAAGAMPHPPVWNVSA